MKFESELVNLRATGSLMPSLKRIDPAGVPYSASLLIITVQRLCRSRGPAPDPHMIGNYRLRGDSTIRLLWRAGDTCAPDLRRMRNTFDDAG